MLSLFLAALSLAPVPAPPAVAEYHAVMKADVNAPKSLAGAGGVGLISVSDDGIRYQIAVAGVRHITNVTLQYQGRAVELYNVLDSRGNVLFLQGMLPAKQVVGIDYGELRGGLASGTATLVVYVTSEVSGVLQGTLKPAP